MKSFKQYVTEKVEGLGNLYHTTSLGALRQIINDNALRLTYSSAIEAETLTLQKPNKPFFLSTSRVKFGNYASKDFKSEYVPDVTINIDIAKLKKYGIPFKDFDYWGQFKGETSPDYREEQEIRIFHNDDKLGPLENFLDSIHIFIKKSGRNIQGVKYSIQQIRKKNPNVPIYFYDNILAYKTQRSEFAIQDIESYLNTIESAPEEESENWGDDTPHWLTAEGDFLIKSLLKIYTGKYNKDKQAPSPTRYATEEIIFGNLMNVYFDNEGLNSIMTNFHNVTRKHPPAFKQWDMAMKKAGAKDTRAFVKMIQDNALKLYDVYGNRKTNETFKQYIGEAWVDQIDGTNEII
tara:strand:- start:105 stop:1151 length:1047 start_codon:yes stop_codon:yes gene_type:complete